MSASIQDMYQRIKGFLMEDVYFYTVLILVVSLLSFGLGRLSMEARQVSDKPHVVLTTQPAIIGVASHGIGTTSRLTTNESKLVASKNGSKYHLLTCPGVKQMSDVNKIYFNSEAEARASGYTPAANCKGL